MTTGTTAGESNSQNNVTSNINTGGGYFSHFGTVGANLIGGFGLLRTIIIIRLQKTITITIYHYYHPYHHQDLEEG